MITPDDKLSKLALIYMKLLEAMQLADSFGYENYGDNIRDTMDSVWYKLEKKDQALVEKTIEGKK